MRIRILALAAGAAFAAAATPVSAAAINMGSDGLGEVTKPLYMNYFAGVRAPQRRSLQQRYDVRMLQLKAEMQQLTVKDGGQLTQAHEISLHRELDGVNRWFGIKPAHG